MSAVPAPRVSAGVRRARTVFIAYALVIAVATHWPRLRVDIGDVPRPDLLIHVGVFGLWSFLCARGSWFGPRFSAGNILGVGALSLVYCAIDEGTQALEFLHRTARWDDLAANILGVALGLGATLVLGALDVRDD